MKAKIEIKNRITGKILFEFETENNNVKKTLIVSEWENDFWNNNSEFPNDGSLKSEYRKLAYESCKKWLELNK